MEKADSFPALPQGVLPGRIVERRTAAARAGRSPCVKMLAFSYVDFQISLHQNTWKWVCHCTANRRSCQYFRVTTRFQHICSQKHGGPWALALAWLMLQSDMGEVALSLVGILIFSFDRSLPDEQVYNPARKPQH